MDTSDIAPSEAAELVLREHQRQREAEKRKIREKAKKRQQSTTSNGDEDEGIKLETVSVPKWEGVEQGEIDECELDRRQRSLSEQLEKRQREVIQQSKQLAKVREELKELEVPIKQEIMGLREKMEAANREEILLVQSVNTLRKELSEKETGLSKIRSEKQEFADQLIRVMADYEKRKTDRLNEIAQLVGVDDGNFHGKSSSKASSFSGF